MPVTALIYPIIRDDFIYKSVETLYKYTKDFKLIVVDQTIAGLGQKWIDDNVHLYIRQKNMGFANAANKGMTHALRSNFDYIGVVNDDTEFMYDGWLPDALEEFKTDPKIIGICPESPRVPLWGYGRPHDENFDLIEYKENYTPEDIAWLKSGDYQKRLLERYEIEPVDLPDGPDGKKDWGGKIYIPINRYGDNTPHQAFMHKAGVIDAIAGWLPIFSHEGLIKLGLFDERFAWGGGEDYDMNARAYSCAWPIPRDECDDKYHWRLVSTMKSWVWHWWGQSKDVKAELDPKLFEARQPWNDLDALYPPNLNHDKSVDPWGHYEYNGIRKPFKRIPDIWVDSL